MKNYFEVLNLPTNASLEEIKRRYRILAKKFHPDINKSPGAHEKFIEIDIAYQKLKDEKYRREFIEYLKNQKSEEEKRRFEEKERQDQYYYRNTAKEKADMSFDKFEEFLDGISEAIETTVRTTKSIANGCLAIFSSLFFGAVALVNLSFIINGELKSIYSYFISGFFVLFGALVIFGSIASIFNSD